MLESCRACFSTKARHYKGSAGKSRDASLMLQDPIRLKTIVEVRVEAWLQGRDPYLSDDDAVDRCRGLVGAVRAPKLLDRLVS